MCKYGPTTVGNTAINDNAIDSNMPVSLSIPRNTPAANITAAIIKAFGACARIRSICSSTSLKFNGNAIATPSINANSGGTISNNIIATTMTVSIKLSQSM